MTFERFLSCCQQMIDFLGKNERVAAWLYRMIVLGIILPVTASSPDLTECIAWASAVSLDGAWQGANYVREKAALKKAVVVVRKEDDQLPT